MSDRRVCGFVPFPGDGAYGHWACELNRWHRGQHRYINYTVPRMPRFWRVKHLRQEWQAKRRLGHLARKHPYRRALYPTTYSPQEHTPEARR